MFTNKTHSLANNHSINIKLFILTSFLTVFLFSGKKSYSQDAARIPSEKPRLILQIQISQFRYDFIPRYWDKLSDYGFKRLINRGSYCENTSYNYLFSDIGVGSATVATGTNPSQHGIVASSWYNNLYDQVIDYIYDEKSETIGGGYEAGRYSPVNMMTTTFADEIKLSNNFKSKVIGVCMHPAPAIFSTGPTADAAYWFDDSEGTFVSSSFYMDSLPSWVETFNAKKFADIYMDNDWNTLRPMQDYSASLLDNNEYEPGLFGQHVFPYNIKDLSKKFKRREKYEVLRYTPFGINLAKDFAISAIVNENLGTDEYTDVLTLSFTETEYIANLFGPLSVEMEDAVLRLDKELAHLLDFIEKQIGKENILVILTAEHGVSHLPEYLEDHKVPSGYFNAASSISLLKSYMNNIYGKGDWIKQYHGQQIYLNRTLVEDAKLNLSDVQTNVANLMLQFSGVSNTMTASTLQSTNFTNGIFSTMQNGYSQKRSGDVLLHFTTGWAEKPMSDRGFASPYGHDRRVPLIWYGWKIGRNSIKRPVDLTDIAPTISTLLEISYPNSATGKPILEIIE
ncbi:MAG: alkaline phosphatase family protein [Bacteroidales bacterium]|nr:alkaline phosphatase family protein [Bacteroidales bacterium]